MILSKYALDFYCVICFFGELIVTKKLLGILVNSLIVWILLWYCVKLLHCNNDLCVFIEVLFRINEDLRGSSVSHFNPNLLHNKGIKYIYIKYIHI